MMDLDWDYVIVDWLELDIELPAKHRLDIQDAGCL
jgi:hypothetical protein